jgi:hypothetical protein
VHGVRVSGRRGRERFRLQRDDDEPTPTVLASDQRPPAERGPEPVAPS